MKYLFSTTKQALNDAYHYLNNLKPAYWLPFLFSFVFLGWNGIQILFSLSLILSFVNTRSLTHLVYTTLEYQLRTIPIYFFILLTFIIIHWVFHCIFEAGLTHAIHQKKLEWKKLYSIGLNFFVPNLIIVLAIFFVVVSLFMISIFVQIVFSGFSVTVISNMEGLVYQALGLSLFLSIIISTWLVDFVLPRMALGLSFKQSMLRSLSYFNQQSFKIISFYLIKLLLVLLSVYVFQLTLRHLLLPFFVMLESKYALSVFLISGKQLVFQNLMINLKILLLVIFSALIIFAPILAPLYLFQRFLLYRFTKL